MIGNTLQGFKQTEVGLIPEDWDVKTLGDVGEVKMCRRVFNHETQSEGPIPFYKIGTFGKDADAYIAEELYNSYRQRFSFPKKGDILISAAGTIGRTLVYDGSPAYYQDSNIVWIDNRETLISNDFLYYVFQIVKYNTEGGTIQRLYNNILKSTKFLLPHSKSEQTAIATALSDTDVLISSLEKLIAKKKAIKQGAMQELLRPKEGWEVRKVGEVFKFLKTANNSWADLIQDGQVEYLHYGDIHTKWNNFLDCQKWKLPFIPVEKVKNIPELKNGDLIIADASEDYEGLAACVEITNIGKRRIVSGLHTMLLRGDRNLISDGYKGYFRNYYGVKEALITLSTGVSVFGISKNNLMKIDIPLPPLKEQSRIARILSDMDAEIEALEKKLEKYRLLKQGMMQVLLTGKIRLVKPQA